MRALGWLVVLISALTAGCTSAPRPASPQVRAFEPWAPVRLERPHPTLARLPLTSPSHVEPSPTSRGALAASAWIFWRGYARLSRLNGDVCRFAPTCSRFGWEAVREHGLPGVVLTFARLLRTHDHSFYRVTESGPDAGFLQDPVEGYLFFWRLPSRAETPRPDDAAQGWHEHIRRVKAGARKGRP